MIDKRPDLIVQFYERAILEWHPEKPPQYQVLLTLLGLLSVAYSTSTNTTLQLASGEAYRGRILSLYSLLFMGTTPIGGAITGLLADTWGVQAAVALEGIVCLSAALVGFAYLRWIRPARSAATLPGPEPV